MTEQQPDTMEDLEAVRRHAAEVQERDAWTAVLGADYTSHLEAQAAFLAKQVAYFRQRTTALAIEVARRDERIMELEGEASAEAPADPVTPEPWP